MNNKYFENVPKIGTLYFEQELFSYDKIPIIFVCIDKFNSRYLCVCDDIIDEESWIIRKITNKELLCVLNDENTILSAYKNRNVIVANKPFGRNVEYIEIEYDKIDRDELPLSDQYLEMKEYLSDYISKIKNSLLTEFFMQSDFIYQNNINEFLQYTLKVNISQEQFYQNIFDTNECIKTNNPSYRNDLSFKIEFEPEEHNNVNQKEWTGYNTMIYYAA